MKNAPHFFAFCGCFSKEILYILPYILGDVIPERNNPTVHHIGFPAASVVAVFATYCPWFHLTMIPALYQHLDNRFAYRLAADSTVAGGVRLFRHEKDKLSGMKGEIHCL